MRTITLDEAKEHSQGCIKGEVLGDSTPISVGTIKGEGVEMSREDFLQFILWLYKEVR